MFSQSNRFFIKGSYTFEKKGAKRVKASTAGAELVRISAAFCASSNGSKLPILVIIPRKKQLENFKSPDNVVILYDTNSNFNSDVISNSFIKRVLKPHMTKNDQSKALLVLDSAPCHLKKDLADEFRKQEIKTLFVPPRMTNLLQPADVSWFRSLKSQLSKKWTEWSLHGEKTFTKNGNMRSPGYVNIVRWVSKLALKDYLNQLKLDNSKKFFSFKLSEIWYDFDERVVINSFDSCGITSSNNLHDALDSIVNDDMIIDEMIVDAETEEDVNAFNVDESEL